MTPLRNYLLCTTWRTGSSALCAQLAATGMAGMQPHASFGAEYLLALRNDWKAVRRRGLRAEEFFAEAFRRSASRNGVGGFKVMWDQLEWLSGRLEDGDDRALGGSLPHDLRCFFLRRADTLGQALSIARAMQTQCWDSESQRRFEGVQIFDYLGIARWKRKVERQNQRWERFFAANQLRPVELSYEAYTSDPAATIDRILEELGVDRRQAPLPDDSYFRRQRDQRTEEWRRRFLELEAASSVSQLLGRPQWQVRRGLALLLTTVRARRYARRLATSRAAAEGALP